MTTPQSFATALSEVTLPSVFNPYSDCCPIHDETGAARTRARNLVRCLEAALNDRVDTIWVARDLGYRGGRRTGVPLTDEIHLPQAGRFWGGIALEQATRGPALAERTAAVVWRALSSLSQPVFLWNVFPLHPHEAGNPLSNRCHTRAEREATWKFLIALVEMVRPRRLVAIGRDAANALSGIDVAVDLVRHPSYGGQTEFIAGVRSIYGISCADETTPSLFLADDQAATAAAA